MGETTVPDRRTDGTSVAFDAFLSHSSKDKRLAGWVAKGLERAKIRAWIDAANIRAGSLLLDVIQQAIVDSHTLVLLWSQAASDSRYVAAEWQAAWHLEKGIIPCRLDGTTLPPFLLRYRFCDFRSSSDAGLSELIEALAGRRPAREPRRAPSPRKPAKKFMEALQQIERGQRGVVNNLMTGKLNAAAKHQSQLDARLESVLRAKPKDPLVLNLAGYHKKNAYLIRHERLRRKVRKSRLLEEAEQYFLEALSARPDDPSALNGLGSVLILRGDLDAAEFFVRRALTKAKEENRSYAAAEHDLRLIEQLKHRRR